MNAKYAPFRQDAIHVMCVVLLTGGLRFGDDRRILNGKKGEICNAAFQRFFSYFHFSPHRNEITQTPPERTGWWKKQKGEIERERDASMQTIQVRCKAENKSDIINIKIPTQVCMHCVLPMDVDVDVDVVKTSE